MTRALCRATSALQRAALVLRMPDQRDNYAYQRCIRKAGQVLTKFAVVP